MHSENSSNSEAKQEIRFAIAMSGGVSLAVWMGGVAREINLLQQASNLRQRQDDAAAGPGWDEKCRELYGKLLELLIGEQALNFLAEFRGYDFIRIQSENPILRGFLRG